MKIQTNAWKEKMEIMCCGMCCMAVCFMITNFIMTFSMMMYVTAAVPFGA